MLFRCIWSCRVTSHYLKLCFNFPIVRLILGVQLTGCGVLVDWVVYHVSVDCSFGWFAVISMDREPSGYRLYTYLSFRTYLIPSMLRQNEIKNACPLSAQNVILLSFRTDRCKMKLKLHVTPNLSITLKLYEINSRNSIQGSYIMSKEYLRIQRGGGQGVRTPPPRKITKIKGFFAILVRILWKITKLPSLGHQRHTSETPFKWRFAGVPITARV